MQVPVWGACGGRSSTPAQKNAADPSYCCASGSTCAFVNEWYHQCLPADGGGASAGALAGTGPSSSTSSITNSRALNLWDQCGGMGGPFAGASCPFGSACSYVNDWYWQCLPSSSAAAAANNLHQGSPAGSPGSPGSSFSASSACSGTTKLVLYAQQAMGQAEALQFCRAQHGPGAYLPAQSGPVLGAAQALVQAARVGDWEARAAVR
jgi:hypothetical protein